MGVMDVVLFELSFCRNIVCQISKPRLENTTNVALNVPKATYIFALGRIHVLNMSAIRSKHVETVFPKCAGLAPWLQWQPKFTKNSGDRECSSLAHHPHVKISKTLHNFN